MNQRRCIGDIVSSGADIHGDREAVTFKNQRWTWRDLERESRRWATMLQDVGVSPGDRVAVAGNPEPRFLFAFLGATRLGAVFQGLSPRNTPDELRFLLDDSEPAIVLDLLGILTDLEFAGPRLTATEVSAGLDSVDPMTREALDRVSADQAAIIVYTSGSTGRPKGALISHDALIRTAEVQARRVFTSAHPSMLCNLPINHIGSVGNICCTVLVAGGRLVFQDLFDPGEVLTLIEEERIEYWGGVPTMLQLSVNSDKWRSADLASLRAILWSGGAAPLPLIRELRRKCERLQMSYGSTETAGEVCFSDADADDETLAHTIGRPADEYEVRIIDEHAAECPEGVAGEITVRGPCRPIGYWRSPDATGKLIDDEGWLRTGDLALRRADGNLVLVGRTHDVFKSGGYNVYPKEIELALEAHPSVQVAAVIPVDDALYGQVGHAWIQPSRTPVDPAGILDDLRQRLAGYKIPKRIIVVQEMPLLAVGKVDKNALKARLGG